MPTITDWLMVLITAIYVVATIYISRANINSANATRAQLVESKRQYEDKKRLEIMPYIQFEKSGNRGEYELNLVLDSGDKLMGTYVLQMCMKNIGMGTAKDIAYTYQWDNCTKSADRGAFPIQALSSGESHAIIVKFLHATDRQEDRTACFLMRYRDLLENTYTQRLNLKFVQNNSMLNLIEFSTSAPVLMTTEDAHT